MKSILILILIAAFGAAAHADTTITLTPSTNPVQAGQSFTIDLLASTDGLYAFEGSLSFTPGALRVDNLAGLGDFADLFGYGGIIDNPAGIVPDFFGSRSGPGLTTGTNVPFARVSVTSLADGPFSVLFLPSFIVTDPDTFALDPNVTSNPLNMTAEPVIPASEPASIWLFGSAILLFVVGSGRVRTPAA